MENGPSIILTEARKQPVNLIRLVKELVNGNITIEMEN